MSEAFLFIGVFYLGFMTLQCYFTQYEPSQAYRRVIHENDRKQNLDCLKCVPGEIGTHSVVMVKRLAHL